MKRALVTATLDLVAGAIATAGVILITDATGAESFITASSYDLPWAWDAANSAFQALGAQTVPSLYLVDRQGRIRLTHVGYSAAEGFLEHLGGRIEALLAETD